LIFLIVNIGYSFKKEKRKNVYFKIRSVNWSFEDPGCFGQVLFELGKA